MHKQFVIGCLAVLLVGCGGDDTTIVETGDMTMPPGADLALPIYKVVSGMYNVSNIVAVSDACMMQLTTTSFPAINVDNDGMGNLKLGSMRGPTDNPPSYNPAAYTNGVGTFSDVIHATTTMTTMVTADSGGVCTYNLTRTNQVTVTGPNKLHIDFTNMASNIASGCTSPPATPTSCTSHFTYDAAM